MLTVFPGLIGHHDDVLCAFRRHLTGNLRHRQPAVIGLPAGHGDSVVEQDLVGDVHARSDRATDRHIA